MCSWRRFTRRNSSSRRTANSSRAAQDLYNEYNNSETIARGDNIVSRDENGVLVDPSTGLPAASSQNSLSSRFLNLLKKVNQGAEGTNIFSFFDFQNIEYSLQDGFQAIILDDDRRRISGHITIQIDINNLSLFRQIIGIKALIEFESNSNIEDQFDAITLITAIENINNDNTQKYYTQQNSLTTIIDQENNKAYIRNLPVVGLFNENEEINFKINFYAQGAYTTELHDMHTTLITFNDFIFANFEDI